MWAKKLYNGSISITKNGFLGQYKRKMCSMKNQSSPEKQTNKQTALQALNEKNDDDDDGDPKAFYWDSAYVTIPRLFYSY